MLQILLFPLRRPKLTAILAAALGLFVAIAYPTFYYSSAEELMIEVKRTTIKSKPNDPVQFYMVFARHDGSDEVFEVRDSWIFMTFNASDRWGALEEGKAARVKVAGFRFPFLSWYRNIVKVYK
jgi:hypothetical protein